MNAQTKVAPSHKNVYVALAAAQMEMGPLVKGSVNPAFKSKYADLADLVLAVRQPLNANGLTYFHQITTMDGERFMRTLLVHGESESRIECDVPLIVDKNNMQGMKSATTYAKRIGLESVTGVAPDDDDGNAAAKAPPVVDDRPRVEDTRPNLASEGLKDAWRDGVLDSLPETATPREKAQAFAAAIVRDFQAKTGTKALDNEWERRKKIIGAFEEQHPDLHETVVDAFENRMNELSGK